MKLLPWSCAAGALILSGCGYIGDPQYPLVNIPEKVTDLSAVQRGVVIIYQFTLPTLTTEGKQARIGQVEIRAGELSMQLAAKPDATGHVRNEIPAGPYVGQKLTLGVKVYGENRRDAGWSNLVTLGVIPPLATPAGLQADAVAEGVRVSWQGAGQHRVFRRGESDKEFVLLGTVDSSEWIDKTTEYGKQYQYMVQAVASAGTSLAESELSDPKQVTPADIFPPAVPSAVNAIAAAENIELVWERNTESDLAGYRVYRGLAGGALEKIAEVKDAPSYSDRKVESGKRYRYAVSAVDRLDNESKMSEPVEITAP